MQTRQTRQTRHAPDAPDAPDHTRPITADHAIDKHETAGKTGRTYHVRRDELFTLLL